MAREIRLALAQQNNEVRYKVSGGHKQRQLYLYFFTFQRDHLRCSAA